MNGDAPTTDTSDNNMEFLVPIDFVNHRYPVCIVWTPIPLLSWLFPFIGHIGICTSGGIIRDFAGPYMVSTDNMAFGTPTRYLQMDQTKVVGGCQIWDDKVADASDVYKGRMHNLITDNCHSHVCYALNAMKYDNKSWNMLKLAALMFIAGKYVGLSGFLRTWIPFLVIVTCSLIFAYAT